MTWHCSRLTCNWELWDGVDLEGQKFDHFPCADMDYTLCFCMVIGGLESSLCLHFTVHLWWKFLAVNGCIVECCEGDDVLCCPRPIYSCSMRWPRSSLLGWKFDCFPGANIDNIPFPFGMIIGKLWNSLCTSAVMFKNYFWCPRLTILLTELSKRLYSPGLAFEVFALQYVLCISKLTNLVTFVCY